MCCSISDASCAGWIERKAKYPRCLCGSWPGLSRPPRLFLLSALTFEVAAASPGTTPIGEIRLFRHLLGLRLVLVGDVELYRPRRIGRNVLVAVNGAAGNIDEVAGLERARRLALYGEGDLALLHRPPLGARVAVEVVAGARRNDDRLQPHLAARVLLQRHLEIGLRLKPWPLGLLRLRPCRCHDSRCRDDGRDYQLVHELLPCSEYA